MRKILNGACNKLSKILNYKKATLGPLFMTSNQEAVRAKNQVLSLLTYIKNLGSDAAIQEFAEKCGTTKGNLLQIAYGGSVSPILSKKISTQTDGQVTLADLRPDIFAET